MRRPLTSWTVLITCAAFAKGCIYPGWASVAELAFCFALVAFQSYFRGRPAELTELEKKSIHELEAIRHQQQGLREELGALQLKLGFRSARG